MHPHEKEEIFCADFYRQLYILLHEGVEVFPLFPHQKFHGEVEALPPSPHHSFHEEAEVFPPPRHRKTCGGAEVFPPPQNHTVHEEEPEEE